MDNNTNVDPWANMGNMAPGSQAGEARPEDLARAAEWEKSMTDAPEFNGGQPFGTETAADTTAEQGLEIENRDESIADASAILNYGLNAAAREKGVEAVVQAINNFIPDGKSDPIRQILTELGVENVVEMNTIADESRAIRPAENTFRSESVNAPTTLNRSESGALNAIQQMKELIAEVQTAPEYTELRNDALKYGKGVFEYAVNKYGTRDLTVLFKELSTLKQSAKTAPRHQKIKLKTNHLQ